MGYWLLAVGCWQLFGRGKLMSFSWSCQKPEARVVILLLLLSFRVFKDSKIVFNYGFYGFLRIGLRQFWGRRLPIGTDGLAILFSFRITGWLVTISSLDIYTIIAAQKRLLLFGCKNTYLFNKVWRKLLKRRIKLSTGVDNFFLRSATATLRMSA